MNQEESEIGYIKCPVCGSFFNDFFEGVVLENATICCDCHDRLTADHEDHDEMFA